MDFETIKTFGSIVGLVTGIYTVWDRWVRGRPLASLSFTPLPGDDGRMSAFVRIHNIGPYDVLIESVTVHPPVFHIMQHETMRGAAEAAFGKIPRFTMKPNEERQLRLRTKMKDGLPLELKPQRIWIKVTWRRGSITWLPQFPILLSTTTQKIRQISLAEDDRQTG